MPAPSTLTTPPPVPTTPPENPPGSYNPAHQPSLKGARTPMPALTDALSAAAGTAPPRQPESSLPQRIRGDEKPAAPPAPEAKPQAPFTAPDEAAPPAPTAPAPDLVAVKGPPAQLRAAYEKLKSEFATKTAEEGATRKELAEFRAKAAKYEDRIKSLESAEARAKELEARALSLDERLRMSDYLNHSEFHDKFTKPVADAISAAHALVAEMVVDLDGTPRQATANDFDAVYSAPNITEATRRARELFGPDLAQTIVAHRQTIQSAERARTSAIKDAALRSQEWLKSQQDAAAQNRVRARETFNQAATTLAERYPTLYRPAESDKEAITAHKSASDLAMLAIEGKPEDMPMDAYVSAIAKVYHRASAFPLQALKVQRLEAELESTRSKLARYEASEPQVEGSRDAGGVVVTSRSTPSDPRSALRAGLEALANQPSR